ncbi:50S ribosomal protein L13 [Sporolactobacillus shoreicorticis]|uniref:Large ribosomal subunit protein uL13 n=1 Tax=Sporolactobacillus shoreicorticis TaxID=1923877 RepID=A0ABW5SC20_9BACL|nr:50S ribosomal protein L13 [Sporolactobacillus shoreicorticis]MCO7127417.1 50S ribosomal protein L13 [Sporolactobacillus shoreicorticis]
MRTTFMANAANVERKWLVVDAEGQTLGRLASEVAAILRGKTKPTFTPHVDCGDHVIIINANKIELTGKKLLTKKYIHHSGFPGGIKARSAQDMRATRARDMLERTIKGMLPHNSLGKKCFLKLHVYEGAQHPHAAQQPEAYTLRG